MLKDIATDLFWSFTNSAYNTIFKLMFIASSAYTVYLMLNDYKPTNDPNIDTFKVQYLLGGSAILALLFPHTYTFFEVCLLNPLSCIWDMLYLNNVMRKDYVGFLYLARICGHSPTVIHVTAYGRG